MCHLKTKYKRRIDNMNKKYVVKAEIRKNNWKGYVADWSERGNAEGVAFQFSDETAMIFEGEEIFEFIKKGFKYDKNVEITKEYLVSEFNPHIRNDKNTGNEFGDKNGR